MLENKPKVKFNEQNFKHPQNVIIIKKFFFSWREAQSQQPIRPYPQLQQPRPIPLSGQPTTTGQTPKRRRFVWPHCQPSAATATQEAGGQ